MKIWQQNLVAEKAEISGKISNLLTFLATYDGINLPEQEQTLLTMQVKMMKALEAVLQARIALFKQRDKEQLNESSS